MKAHQRIIRERRQAEDADVDLFGRWWEGIDLRRENAEVRRVDYQTAAAVILKYEWLGTMPSNLTVAYGLFFDGNIAAVECFSDKKPAGQFTINKEPAICLARGACVHWAPEWSSSYLIASSVKALEGGWHYAIAYSDADAGEIGTVYQAAGWHCIGTVENAYWLSPLGKRFDKAQHRHRCRRRIDGKTVVAEADQRAERARMEAAGWRYMRGGVRYRYAVALGRGRDKRQRDTYLRSIAAPYPKRAVEVSRLIHGSQAEGEVGFLNTAPAPQGDAQRGVNVVRG